MNTAYLLGAVAVMGVATLLTRLAPFWLLSAHREAAWLRFLGRYLPPAVMSVLVLYCLRGIDPGAPDHGLPQLLGVVVTVVVHLLWRQSLASIAAGTATCMLLLRLL